MRVGLVSDTHGLFEPALERLFEGCDLILHAGDVVGAGILGRLARLAPVRAVRGNNDLGPDGGALPEIAWVELGALTAIVIHEVGAPARPSPALRRAMARRPAQIVVHGHSHRPGASREGGVLFVNPGSAGRRRFSLPRAAGLLDVDDRRARVRLFDVASARLPLLEPPLEVDL